MRKAVWRTAIRILLTIAKETLLCCGIARLLDDKLVILGIQVLVIVGPNCQQEAADEDHRKREIKIKVGLGNHVMQTNNE